MKLLIASHNKGKIKEFKNLLANYPQITAVSSLEDYPELPEVEETGTTFTENALLKAETIAELTGKIVLADDSGLSVPALGGEPGIYSARYAGVNATDEDNINKLLANLEGKDDRRAYFTTVLALSHPGSKSLVVEGVIWGEIIDEPRGEDGFGYDPIFYVEEFGQTFAEVGSNYKNKVSHRAKAMGKLATKLSDWLDNLNIS